jgi:hypothetical protein
MAERSNELVLDAARKVSGEHIGIVALGLPILDAVCRSSWEESE